MRRNSDGKTLPKGLRGHRETATGRSRLASLRYIRRRFAIIWSTFSGFLAGERDFPSRRGACARILIASIPSESKSSDRPAAPRRTSRCARTCELHGNFQVSASTRLDHDDAPLFTVADGPPAQVSERSLPPFIIRVRVTRTLAQAESWASSVKGRVRAARSCLDAVDRHGAAVRGAARRSRMRSVRVAIAEGL